jgi:hypothetical protein
MTTIKPKAPAAVSPATQKVTSSVPAPQPQKPLGGWQSNGVYKMDASTRPAQHEMGIVCPVLAAMVKDGKMPMDKDGNVKFKDLRAAGRALDFSKPMELALPAIAVGGGAGSQLLGNIFSRQFNVLELRSGLAKHAGDSAILNSGKFDEERFQAFTAHAENGRMTISSFAAAIADNLRRDNQGAAADARKTGQQIVLAEYSPLLAIFGTKDPSTGELGIPVSDLRELFQNQKLPQTTGASISETIAIRASMAAKVDASLSAHSFDSTTTATGLSRAGVRMANGDEPVSGAAAQAAVSAGKAANCPHLNAQAKMPGKVKDAVNAHTSVGLTQ